MDFKTWWERDGRVGIRSGITNADEAEAFESRCRVVALGAWAVSKGEDLSARLLSEKWFRDTIAEVMGTDAPGGDGVNPLREWLLEFRTLRQWSELKNQAMSPEPLLQAVKSLGGHVGVLAEAGLIAIRKGGDYNKGVSSDARDEYFPLGLASYAQMIWVKALRLVSFAKVPRDANNEGVRDTLLDLINYASFAADWLARRKS